MATRKPSARGTSRRPAKATATIGKSRAAAKKPLKVSTETATPEPESNVVPLTAAETSAPEPVTEPAPVVEEAVVEAAAKPEPAPVEEVAELEAVEPEETPEPDAPAEEETVLETKVDAAWPFGFSSSAMFPGFPQMGQMPKMPSFSDFPAFGAVDMSAFVTSGTVLAEGMRSLGEEVMAFSRKSAERNVETTMAVLGASSVEEVVDLQSRHAMGSVDEMVSEGAKLTGMAIDVAQKAAAPFTRV